MKRRKSIFLMLFVTIILVSMSSCLVTQYDNDARHRAKYKHNNNHGYYNARDHRNVLIINPDNHGNKKAFKQHKSKNNSKHSWDRKK